LLPLVSTLASEIIPSLIKEHVGDPGEDVSHHTVKSLKLVSQCDLEPIDGISKKDLRYFADKCANALLELNSEQLEEFAQNLFEQGLDMEVFYLDIIPLVARELHDYWDKDEITFFDVTRATWSIKRLIYSLSPQFIKPDTAHMMPAVNRFQVLVATAPGAQHTLGPLLVSQYLQRKGWHLLPGFDHDEAELLNLVSDHWIDLICISVSLSSETPRLKSWVAKIKARSKNAHIQCIVGGPLLAIEPELVNSIGAHASCAHPRDAHSVGLKLVRVHRKLRKLHLLSAAELSGSVSVKFEDSPMNSERQDLKVRESKNSLKISQKRYSTQNLKSQRSTTKKTK